MKKLFRLIRSFLVFFGWTYLFYEISLWVVFLLWNFNISSPKSWGILQTFWNNGGVLKTTSDILLLATLIFLPLVWLTGFFFALKINYTKLFSFPISLFRKTFKIEKNKIPERIIIKNIKSSNQAVEDIKMEIESIKPQKSIEADHIRSQIIKKLSNEPQE